MTDQGKDIQEQSSASAGPAPSAAGDEGRRAFLKLGVGGIGAGLAAIVVAPALQATLWPLAEGVEVTSGGGEFVVVGRRKDFGKTPVKVDIYADRVDAWNRTKNVKIGSAWVVERDGKLHAFTTVCPHLGCAVDYDAEAKKFKCPCHDSAFGLDGSHEEGPSPRALDALEMKPEAEDGLISIRYVRYKQGEKDQVEA